MPNCLRVAHATFQPYCRRASRPGRYNLLLALVLAIGAVACGPASGLDSVKYAVAAEGNYERGMAALARKDWEAARAYFIYIRDHARFSKYATLAELRLADAEFGGEMFIEAIEAYRAFIRFHPTHEEVVNGYAAFRIGDAYAKQLVGDSWIMPPSFEMDQTAVEEAGAEMQDFVKKYPASPYLAQAQKVLAEVAKRQAAHEWYVANYYWKKDKAMATVLRLRRLLESFRGVGYDEEALWLLGRAYVAANLPDRARLAWSELVEKHPTHKHASAAKAALTRLPPKAAP